MREFYLEILQRDRPLGRPAGAVVLRLGSSAAVDARVTFLDPEELAPRASDRLRREYPAWALSLAHQAGLLDLYLWKDQLSYWWFTPFSENNARRTPLIQHLYWLCLAEVALEQGHYDTIHLVSDVAGLAEPLASLATQRGVALGSLQEPSAPGRPGWLSSLAVALRHRVRRVAKWLLARHWAPWPAWQPDLALFSFYPSFFEGPRERLFGDWCEKLESKGHRPLVVAQWTGGRRPPPGVIYQESLLSWRDILELSLDFTFLKRYRSRGDFPVPPFRGWNLSGAARCELDREILELQEATHSASLALGVANLVRRYPGLKALCLTFENQPRERAVLTGVRLAGRRLPVVGFDISMFCTTHLPWFYAADQAFQPFHQPWEARQIPLVDYLVCYGTASRDHFRERMGPERVVLAGAVRYHRLARALRERAKDLGFPPGSWVVAVALTFDVEDSQTILRSALRVAARHPECFLAVKCHPLRPLDVEGLSQGFARLRVFQEDLYDLIKAARVLVTGLSSVGAEAMVLGCYPVMLTRPGAWEDCALRDHPGMGSFHSSGEQLELALECQAGPDQGMLERWRGQQDQLLFGLDGQASERAYQALVDWQIL